MDALTAVILGRLAKILAKNLLKDQAKNAKAYHEVKNLNPFTIELVNFYSDFLFFKHFYHLK
jgi:hypothetical protein